jgi:hypothetical protein
MSQFIGLMLIGAGLYAGYRALLRAAGRMSDELQQATEEVRRPIPVKDLGRLEYDPATGEYRPARRR